MITKIFLIRHGETDWNKQRRYCGHSDIPLNKKGMRQAKKISRRIKHEKFDTIYSSTAIRAIQTANLATGNKPLRKIAKIREMNFGIFEGLTHQQLLEKYPKIYQTWLNDPVNTKIPQGESAKQFANRIKNTLGEIITKNKGNTIAIFAHAGSIRIIIADILKLSLKNIWKIKQDSACINIIEVSNNIFKIKLKNYTTHLN